MCCSSTHLRPIVLSHLEADRVYFAWKSFKTDYDTLKKQPLELSYTENHTRQGFAVDHHPQ